MRAIEVEDEGVTLARATFRILTQYSAQYSVRGASNPFLSKKRGRGTSLVLCRASIPRSS